MYYTAPLSGHSRHHCIGAAASPKDNGPAGPYSPLGKDPLICPSPTGVGDVVSAMIPSSGKGGAKDAFSYLDSDTQQRYILFKVDGNSLDSHGPCGNGVEAGSDRIPTPIMMVAVKNDGITPNANSYATQILGNDEQDPDIIESPTLIRDSEHNYLLVYTSGCFLTSTYSVKVAVAQSMSETFWKAGPLDVSGSIIYSDRLGGLAFAADGKHMAYHALFQGVRSLYTGLIEI